MACHQFVVRSKRTVKTCDPARAPAFAQKVSIRTIYLKVQNTPVMSEYDNKLDRILNLSTSIRFVAVASMEGGMLAYKTRPGITPYLNLDETKDTIKHAVAAWKSRMKHYNKIGAGLYTLAVYEKLRRVTIPLKSGNLMLVTFDNQGGQQQIVDHILNEVLYHDYTMVD